MYLYLVTQIAKMAPDSLGLVLRKEIIDDYMCGMSQKRFVINTMRKNRPYQDYVPNSVQLGRLLLTTEVEDHAPPLPEMTL